MKAQDQSQRFLFEDHPIRGQHVSLDQTWQQIAQQGNLKGRALDLLGESLVVVALLVDTLKIEGSITLQIRGTGPLELLVVEARSDNSLRGTARQTGEIDQQMDLRQVFGSEYLVITIKTEGAEPHQGIASLQGSKISTALENYFASSEQLPTQFHLACDGNNASGMLIQRLPGKANDADAWDRVQHLASTISHEELLGLQLEELLQRLFHDETLSLFEPRATRFHCNCSRENTASMLLSLGKVEVDEILEQEGDISITCEFCSSDYRFESAEIEALFSDNTAVPSNVTTH